MIRSTNPGRWSKAISTLAIAAAFISSQPVAHAADMSKTLRVAFLVDVSGFDPQAMSDAYSGYVMREIFDAAFKYDFLARPYKLVPNTAEALPVVTDDGKTITFKVKPGIFFAADPAFKGQRRELVAADYVYTYKRLLDPKVRSPINDSFIEFLTIPAYKNI